MGESQGNDKKKKTMGLLPFGARKEASMASLSSSLPDKSRKGGVDQPIAALIMRINGHPSFFTTSSCSGRISVLLSSPHSPEQQQCPSSSDEEPLETDQKKKMKTKKKKKKGGEWIFISHDPADPDSVTCILCDRFRNDCPTPQSSSSLDSAVFRFEPFILALECLDLSSAQALVSCAISSGFRESGLTSIGKRIIAAVRCSIRMEVPIVEHGQLLVSTEYIRFLIKTANAKMQENQQRIERFMASFIKQLEQHDLNLSKNNDKVTASTISRKGFKISSTKFEQNGLKKSLNELKYRQMQLLSRITKFELVFHEHFEDNYQAKQLGEKKSHLRNSTQQGNMALEPSARIRLCKKTQKKNVQSRRLRSCAGKTVTKDVHTKWVERNANFGTSSPQQALQNEGRLTVSALELEFLGKSAEKLYRWGHSSCVLNSIVENQSSTLLIFGGYGGPSRHSRLNDLLILDLESKCLKGIEAKGAPSLRMGHSSTLIGKIMVVIGGREDPSKPLIDVCFLDIETLQWSFPEITGDQFTPRHRHAAVDVRGKIFVFGGFDSVNALADFWVLDISLMQWSKIGCNGEVPSARYSHSLVVFGDKMYLFGGTDGKTVYGDLYVLDLNTFTWEKVNISGSIPVARFSHSMISFDKFLLVFGGCPVTKQTNDLFVIDISCFRSTRVKVLPGDRLLVRHTANVLGKHLVIVGGGSSCYAFGAKFSPSFFLDLSFLLELHEEVNMLDDSGTMDGLLNDDDGVWVLKSGKSIAKKCKDSLKSLGWLDTSKKVNHKGAYVAFPLHREAACILQYLQTRNNQTDFSDELFSRDNIPFRIPSQDCEALQNLLSCGAELHKKAKSSVVSNSHRPPHKALYEAVAILLQQHSLSSSLLCEVPKRWERLGDMVIIPSNSFISVTWTQLGEELWIVVAKSLGVSRVARQAPVARTDTRDSNAQLLLGKNAWVKHRENGITYCFDVTKCMFSSGNVSEKARISNINCKDEVVVDLFAGIGYFVLPFLIRSRARLVYACEKNPHSLEALRHNLYVNNVSDQCIVLEGDNRIMAPKGVADRVCLGLLPSSEASWAVAVRALRPKGGVLHVHGNVTDVEEQEWVQHVRTTIADLSRMEGLSWNVKVEHVERVKWYAPHIRHLVADVICKHEEVV